MSNERLKGALAAAGANPAETRANLVRSFSAFLEGKRGYLAETLPRNMDPQRLIRIAITEFANSEKLQRCSALSIYSALLQAAAVGLEIGVAGQSFLVPFKDKTGRYQCQWIPGYRGLITLMRRSGEIGDIRTECVHENDFLQLEMGLYPICKHIPNLKAPRGDMILVYGVAEYISGGRHLEFMTRGEIEDIRARSKATSEFSPWQTDFLPMARKSVIRRMSKVLPMSIEAQMALDIDEYASQGRRAEIVDGVVTPIDDDEPPEPMPSDFPEPLPNNPRREPSTEPEPA